MNRKTNHQLIHHLFESQAGFAPNAVAVACDSTLITYGELNTRANQLAHHLIKLGVERGEVVGVCLERSEQVILGLLGVLKAGGVCLPVAPANADDRPLSGAGLRVVLTQRRLVESLPVKAAKVLYLDSDWPLIAQASERNPAVEVAATDPAFLFLPESTDGQKGNRISHHSLMALARWSQEKFTPDELAGVLACSPLGSDMSLLELLVPLGRGGKVVMADGKSSLAAGLLAGGVTLFSTSPTELTELMEGHGIPLSVRAVILLGADAERTLFEKSYRQNGDRFVLVADLPLTPDESVDFDSLLTSFEAAGVGQPEATTVVVSVELAAEIWRSVLEVDEVGLNDDFFDLGGNSLSATRIISKVRILFQVELPVRILFQSPTVAEFVKEVEAALQASGEALALPMEALPRDETAPLSFAQQRLWFLDQMEPDSPFYNMASAVRISGALRVDILERVFNEIVRRHEALRTIFASADGQPVQIIAPVLHIDIGVEYLSSLPAPEREADARRLSAIEARSPFDLSRGPLLRLKLLRLTEDEHVLLMTMHHIVSDGWSMRVLVREMSALYEAFVQGRLSPLPDLPVQYADFAIWQRRWLSGEVLEAQLSYWKKQLEGAPGVLDLPADRPRPPIQTYDGAVAELELPGDLAERLRSLSRRSGATLYMVLLAAFDALVYRYTGQTDILIGSPIANRNHSEIEGLIGCFINTLVLRARVTGEMTFVELLEQVRESSLEAYANQDVPFEKLVEELQPERDLSRHPLFQVIFMAQKAPLSRMELPGLTLSTLPDQDKPAKFDLALVTEELDERLIAYLTYNKDLFDKAKAERMLRHFEALLDDVTREPQRPIAAVTLLSADERHQVTREFSGATTDYPRDTPVHKLFEAQAAMKPDAVAVSDGVSCLTYRELNERANQLAQHLQGLGVGPESLVVLSLERSPAMIVAMLAALKAGGAYLPLDQSYPAARIRLMCEDAGPQVIVTQRSQRGSLPPFIPAVYLDDEAEAEAIASYATEDLRATGAAGGSLACVIYTSGSTGKPKGVCITHRAINRLIINTNYVSISAEDIVGQTANASFDGAIFEIWGTLLNGARLVILDRELTLAAGDLAQRVRDERLSTLFLTTALFNQMAAEAPWTFSGLRNVLFGGEAAEPNGVNEVLEAATTERLVNGYGPTENTTFTTCEVMRAGEHINGSVSIGRPISNSEVYVLDASMEPVAIGVTGELYTGGDGLARGYLQRPDLTAERFVPHPFSQEPGERLYRTGDLARWLPDGRLEFLGRRDLQAKIRGYRIELGEIEAVLGEHAPVSNAVVIVREDAPGDKRLVAYVVAEAAWSNDKARVYLRERLPEYMVPAAFVRMETLPLTPNGKVDRRALPAPDWIGAAAGTEYIPPRTPTEQSLVEIWAEVLGVSGGRLGIHDNFFELGGHSILATQVVSRIRRLFQLDLPVRSLFQSPTVASLAEQVEAELRAGTGIPVLPIERITREQELPLSFAQQRLWFLSQMEPDSPFYNVPVAVRMQGVLRVDVLEKAFNEIVRRHEVLRTAFDSRDGQPVQVVTPRIDVKLKIRELQHLSAGEQEAAVTKFAGIEARAPFNLSTGPLLRVGLLRLAEEDHVLLLTMHHIVSDGWSIGVLIRELAALYTAFAEGREAQLPELVVQYADFAHWQREWLSGDVLETQLSYWRQQLEGAPTAIELPTDRPRPPIQTYSGETFDFELPAQLAVRLRALGRESGTTLYMVLLAAFDALLYGYTGQADLLVGSPIANRRRTEIEPLIGCFTNTLMMRARMSDEMPFIELLEQVRETALAAYANQDVPFEKLVEELQPERDMSRHPLFQVALTLQNAPMSSLGLPGLTLVALGDEKKTAKFDFNLIVEETERGLAGTLYYNTDLFDQDTMNRLHLCFKNLLEAVVDDPRLRISELPLLAEEELRRVTFEWNETATDYPSGRCVNELFEEQAARAPEAVAIAYEGIELTYGQLNADANQLAHHLRTLGVGPEVLVGVCLERSPQVVTSLLAVLKAGGAYLPLDPSYPLERLAFMLEEAQVPVLITEERLADKLPAHWAQTVYLDADQDLIKVNSVENPRSGTTAENLAYVMYTSGSTGRPKGISVIHRGIVRLVRGADYADFSPHEVFLQFAPVSFDASTFEVWGALLNGARLAVAPATANSIEDLGEQLRRHGVTTLWLTAGLFHVMVDERLADLSGLRQLLAGGDVLSVPRVERFFRSRRGCTLINGYGPTEGTTFSCHYRMTRHTELQDSVPIGRPLSNTQVYILDSHLRPVPVGVYGTLYIGGDGLARDYLHRPELTAERFVPNPFGAVAGARLYNTGDRTRYLPDGNIEFHGRLDRQVKVRGFRIELDEVEAAISEHEAVQEAVVVAREDEPDDKRLVAYLVGDIDVDQLAGELRAYLRRKLPEYMIPAAFVRLEALPLNPNGKVERRALPAPDWSAATAGTEFVRPRTAAAELLLGIWANVLGLDAADLSMSADFFELGGHSLIATVLVSRVREVFKVELPLRDIFQWPTVAGMAAKIETLLRSGESVPAPPLEPFPRDEELPLSFAQQRLWFLSQMEPDSPFYNVPVGVRITGALRVAVLERVFNEIVKRHEALRTTFDSRDGQPFQVIAPQPEVRLEVIEPPCRVGHEQEIEVQRLADVEARAPFDLSIGPLLRVKLLRLGDEDHVLLVTMHHIVSDGWSISVLINELAALYEAFAAGSPSPLRELPVQYADFAHWQRQWLSGDVLEAQLSYWRRQLEGMPAALELPTDRPRPPVQTYDGEMIGFTLPAELVERLRILCRQSGTTLYMVLLAAFDALLYRYTGQDDLLVGSPIANRGRAEVEGLIGFFVNTLVLRAQLSGEMTFAELLKQVRNVALEAYANQDVPFEKLVEELQPERDLSRHPLFQVAFTLHDAFVSRLELSGLSMALLLNPNRTAKFDLTLVIEESEQGLAGTMNYNLELFDRDTAKRMLRHFEALLDAVTSDPQQPVAALPLLAEEELRQVTLDWNNTAVDYPRETPVHQLFEAQVERTPEAPAVAYGHARLTYGELNAALTSSAHRLGELGVGPESLVGLCLERSPDLVVAMLAALKAGGAYLPLRPLVPGERLRFMCEDAAGAWC